MTEMEGKRKMKMMIEKRTIIKRTRK